MRLLTILFISVSINCNGQKSAKGNYLMINPWTISFIELNARNEVKWYTKGCTDEGTMQHGVWTRNEDTIHIELADRTSSFVVVESKLCHLEDDGIVTEREFGIPRTFIQTRWRVHVKARRLRKRR